MRFEISLFIESFDTVFKGADVVSIARMLLKVHLQTLLPTVRLIATLDRTDKVLHRLVCVGVVAQVAARHKRFATPWLLALKRPIIFELAKIQKCV